MKTKILTLLTLTLLVTNVKAFLVLSDQFTYTNGPIVGAPGSPWNQSPGGTAGTSLITNNMLELTFARSEDINAELFGNPYTTNGATVLYSSFKVKFSALPTAAGSYFAHFKDTNTGAATGFGGRVWASTANAAAGFFRLGIVNGTGPEANASSGQIATDLDTNTTYTVVTRFVPSTGIATIWLNPADESDPSVTATDPGTETRPNPIDVVAYAFRQATGIGTMVIDDLKVGTAFSDVACVSCPPTITSIPNQRIPANSSTGPIPFTVSDLETPAGSLTVSGSSSNTVLVPNANIMFVGTGANRTVTVIPAAGQQGTTTIAISVTDGDMKTSTTAFQITVGAPSISNIPNQMTHTNVPAGPITFTVSDGESSPGSLTLTKSSSNTSLVPDDNIAFGGGGSNRTVTVTPLPDTSGVTTITVTVSDGLQTATDTFVLTVSPTLGVLRCDDFNRADGSLVDGSGAWLSNGGTGGTNIGQVKIVGNKVLLTSTNSEDVTTELPPNQAPVVVYTAASGAILYASLTINYVSLPAQQGDYFAHFKGATASDLRGRIFASTTNAAPGTYRLGVANNAAALPLSAQLATDLAPNTPYRVVLRYNVSTAESKLWLSPISESSPGVSATDNTSSTSIESFSFRQNPGIGTVCVDDLKVGGSFSDVVSPALTIVRDGAGFKISWPIDASIAGYSLERTLSLSPPVSWSPFGSPSVDGDQYVVAASAPPGTAFFRLKRTMDCP